MVGVVAGLLGRPKKLPPAGAAEVVPAVFAAGGAAAAAFARPNTAKKAA